MQWARGILGTEIPLSNSGLNSVPYVGSTIITADFSLNALNLNVRIKRVLARMIICGVSMLKDDVRNEVIAILSHKNVLHVNC